MSSSKKTMVVVGATGNQGSSVAKTFLSLPNWHVRCLTRDPSSSKAQDLAAQGAEIVQGDLTDIASLQRAFRDANAIFVNTVFFGTQHAELVSKVGFDASCKTAFDVEVLSGKNAANAAASVPTLERFVYSALGPMAAASGGKYKCLHWESKAAIVQHIEREVPALAAKTSYIYIGAYSTNRLLRPVRNLQTEAYSLVTPMPKKTRLPIIDPLTSTGVFVRCLVEDEEPGVRLVAYDSSMTIEEAAETWSRVTGRDAVVVETTVEHIHQMTKTPLEILNAAGYLAEFDYVAGVSGVVKPAQLKTAVTRPSFEDFLRGCNSEELL